MSFPSGYTQLEYIQSSGTQYINTGFIPKYDSRIVLDAEVTDPSIPCALFGARGAASGTNPSANALFSLSGGTIRSDYYGSSVSSTTTVSGRTIFDKNKNVVSFGSNTITNNRSTASSNQTLFLFAVQTAGSATLLATMKLYACQIYDNGTLVRDFYPCTNESGAVGLYDLVGKQFYSNAGTGAFVAGAEVKGSHKALIDGTWYDLKAGECLVGGTAYSVKNGRVLVNSTGYNIPFSKGIPLNTITPGAILYINESGSPVPFYIAKHDYESGLNGAGRTLLVRKDCYDMRAFSSGNNAYANSSLDSWLRNTYLKLLDADIRAAIGTTKFYYTPGDRNDTVTTLQRAVFQLSVTELGKTSNYANTEGSALPIARTLQIAYRNGSAVVQWTRTPRKRVSNGVYYLNNYGGTGTDRYDSSNGSRPVFTLPATTVVIANADGTYTLAA